MDNRAAQVHAIMAAGLADPGLIASWLEDSDLASEQFSSMGVDSRKFDIQGLRRFAGFVTKVQQNPLRNTVPLTLLVLSATGLEIEVFADYAPYFVKFKQGGVRSTDERTSAFVDFIDDWLDPTDPDHMLVKDMIRHELTLKELQQLSDSDLVNRIASSSPAVDHIPAIQGLLRIHQMSCNPREVMKFVHHYKRDLSSLQRGEFLFGYWWNAQMSEIRIIELEPMGAYFFSLIDGARTVCEMSEYLEEVSGHRINPNDLLKALQDVIDIGLVVFHSPLSNVATNAEVCYAPDARR